MTEMSIPSTLDGVPVDLEIADPFQQLLSEGVTEQHHCSDAVRNC